MQYRILDTIYQIEERYALSRSNEVVTIIVLNIYIDIIDKNMI